MTEGTIAARGARQSRARSLKETAAASAPPASLPGAGGMLFFHQLAENQPAAARRQVDLFAKGDDHLENNPRRDKVGMAYSAMSGRESPRGREDAPHKPYGAMGFRSANG